MTVVEVKPSAPVKLDDTTLPSKLGDTNLIGDEDVMREGPARFLAFASRAARLIAPYSQKVRYMAFSSDVGEAARPIAHPKLVTASYGLTLLYVFGDIGAETFHQWRKTPTDSQRIKDKALRTTVFQLLASVALPFIIM
jgi:fission process protein 1